MSAAELAPAAPRIRRAAWPAGTPYTSRQKIRGAGDKRSFAGLSHSERDQLAKAPSAWGFLVNKKRKANKMVKRPWELLERRGLDVVRLSDETAHLYDRDMGGREFRCLGYLALTCLERGHEWFQASHAALAKLLHCTPRQIQRAIYKLERRGLITSQARYGSNRALDRMAAPQGAKNPRAYDWRLGNCYRPTGLLLRLWAESADHATEYVARSTEIARARDMPHRSGEATPGSGSDPKDVNRSLVHTPMPSEEGVGPEGPDHSTKAAIAGIVAKLSEVWTRQRQAPCPRPPPMPAQPPAELKPNGHHKRCTCAICSEPYEREFAKFGFGAPPGGWSTEE